jgi:hypothetical protein
VKYGVTAAVAITKAPPSVNEMRETIVSQNGLEGTFVRPDVDGPFPAVLIIAGSGPTDRDGSQQVHAPASSRPQSVRALVVFRRLACYAASILVDPVDETEIPCSNT